VQQGNQVILTNNHQGSFGNQPLTTTVSDPGFAVNGMSGGVGYDCPKGAGCTRDEDCQSGLKCTSSQCQP
jgi:hypothetical protein